METVKACLEASETASMRSLAAGEQTPIAWRRQVFEAQPALAALIGGKK